MALTPDGYEQNSHQKKLISRDASKSHINETSYSNITNRGSAKKTFTEPPASRRGANIVQRSSVGNGASESSAIAKTRSVPAPSQSGSNRSRSSDDSTTNKKPTTTPASSRVVEKEFNQNVLNYIQAIHFEDINKFRNKYGVDFEMKGNGIVQVRQRNPANGQDMKNKVAMGELAELVNSLEGSLESHVIDLRKFEETPQKIINMAISNAKQNKEVIVKDGPGCKVEFFGTKDKIQKAVGGFDNIIKTGKVDDKRKQTMKSVGKSLPRTSPTNASFFGKQPSSSQSERETKKNLIPHGVRSARNEDTAEADDFDFQAARRNEESTTPNSLRSSIFNSIPKSGDFDFDATWQTEESISGPNSVNSRVFNTMEPAFDVSNEAVSMMHGIWGNHDVDRSMNSLLRDPRNYAELNEEAQGLITSSDAIPVDDDQDDNERQNWYEGDLASVMTNSSVTQHTSMRNMVTAANSYSTEYTGGACGGGDFDDSDEDTSPGGLMDDIGNYGDLEDEVPASKPLVFHTSAGFDIEIQQGDITSEFVSVIVTSADPHLRPNTGAARAVQKAGGMELVKECQKWVETRGTVDLSRPVYTSGGNLMCSQVLHVIPPDQTSGAAGFGGNPLIDVMRSVMKICARPLEATSIAMPAIGIGEF